MRVTYESSTTVCLLVVLVICTHTHTHTHTHTCTLTAPGICASQILVYVKIPALYSMLANQWAILDMAWNHAHTACTHIDTYRCTACLSYSWLFYQMYNYHSKTRRKDMASLVWVSPASLDMTHETGIFLALSVTHMCNLSELNHFTLHSLSWAGRRGYGPRCSLNWWVFSLPWKMCRVSAVLMGRSMVGKYQFLCCPCFYLYV